VEAGEQVDPQPRAQGVREALTALRGAKITAFESASKDSYKLSYEVNGEKRSISYSIKADGNYPFEFDNGSEGKANEVYTSRGQGSQDRQGSGPEGKRDQGKGKGKGKGGREGVTGAFLPREGSNEGPRMAPILGILDVNGDGVVTAQEFADNAKSNAAKKVSPSPRRWRKRRSSSMPSITIATASSTRRNSTNSRVTHLPVMNLGPVAMNLPHAER
jgi:hypothetical protein